MDIAAVSMSLSQSRLSQAVSVQVLSLAKGQAEAQGQDLVKMMEKSADPNLGKSLDISI
ncbi:YjfB family protein [Paenibacillus pinistramenti]|uniref:YjfB family protein n=1 Tax=Paenibacillus pinistramenti TaxID=1768003 RepID=UPI00110854AD|nr:YjfB family protein [Paenibacillus pinistramenti]